MSKFLGLPNPPGTGSDVGTTPGFVGADGYVAFFTGENAIAGDNDFFWNRAENKLEVKSVELNGQIYGPTPPTTTPAGTTATINWNNGNGQIIDLEDASGDVTVTFVNAQAGSTLVLEVYQDSAVARDIVWPGTVTWQGGVVPVISAGNNAEDLITFYFNGIAYKGSIGQNYS